MRDVMGRQGGYTRQEGSSDNLYSVSSVERRRQAREAAATSLRRRQVKYNLTKYKLSQSGRKLKRRLQAAGGSGRRAGKAPSEKVSVWHQDIFMVTPRRLGGGQGMAGPEHPRSCVCSSCLAQFGTYHYYRRAMQSRERREERSRRSRGGQEQRSAKEQRSSQEQSSSGSAVRNRLFALHKNSMHVG